MRQDSHQIVAEIRTRLVRVGMTSLAACSPPGLSRWKRRLEKQRATAAFFNLIHPRLKAVGVSVSSTISAVSMVIL